MSIATEKSFRIPVELEEPGVVSPPKSQIQKLTGEILKNKTTGVYNYINDIPPINLFVYISVIIGVTYFTSKFKVSGSNITGLVIGIAVVYFLNERNRALNVDELKTIEIQMESIIPKPRYFYIDANIIELVYNLMEFNNYNPQDFESMVLSIDNLLKLRLDVERGMEECAMIYDVAVEQKNKAMNSLSSIIISIPSQHVLKEKLLAGIKILHLYLYRHLDFIKGVCNSQNKMDIIDQIELPPEMDRYNIF